MRHADVQPSVLEVPPSRDDAEYTDLAGPGPITTRLRGDETVSEMVERVARAMCRRHVEEWESSSMRRRIWELLGDTLDDAVNRKWKDYEGDAKVATAAMREPTDAMAEAGAPVAGTTRRGMWQGWQAMIDIALSETETR